MNSERSVGRVHQINVKPESAGERGLPKHPVNRVAVKKTGLIGDFNRWRHEEAHDDPRSAVLIMPLEMIQELNHEGLRIQPGDIGENFTTVGIPYDSFAPGKRYSIGGAVIKITKPCDPCNNLYVLPNIGKGKDIVKAMYQRRGWYASVEQEGNVLEGDNIKELPQE
ncbi:MAG TPA: MOSC domain-containing protein [Candidatus Saccharimonadales bacterium]|jgi:MOSC domain-containing protein YiiM|nr:MOSC domain-containing protein [Candidatus Saccharimonadales bacterium]